MRLFPLILLFLLSCQEIKTSRGSRDISNYVEHRFEGFSVRVKKKASDHPKLKEALVHLRERLKEAKALAPKLADLAGQVIFVFSESNDVASLAYFSSGEIEIANIDNFLAWNVPGDQPAMIIHELVHAYHGQVLGFDDPAILSAYRNALAKGLYGKVRYQSASGPFNDAYARINEKEFFAEVSEAYFFRNDYYPFENADLQFYDSATFSLLVTLWGAPGFIPEPVTSK